MMEVLTKKFWLDAKKIFDEARREPPPAPQPKPVPDQPVLEEMAEDPKQATRQQNGDGQSQDPGHRHVADGGPLQP